MCGIAGIYSLSSHNKLSLEQEVRKMLSLIRHRGPDESGIYLNDSLAIGNARLSIIDLKSGRQPMTDDSGNYWIVYNGEIFNYPELQKDLQKKGIHLKTNCDTEVVVQMYALYGPDCLQHFNGQFSFCIWDKKKKECFLARDRVGILPLFYSFKNGLFSFCSEIKGLMALSENERAICYKGLAQIFTFWTTATTLTPFKDIYQLPPAHYMVVNSEGINTYKYWESNLSYPGSSAALVFSDTVAEFKELLTDAVKIRLRADVPVGAYLSGGLDSTTVTSLIHSIEPRILNTFSIGFEDPVYDETSYQMEAARYLNTRHHAFKCSEEDIRNSFEKAVWHTEFPVLRTAPIPMYLLSGEVHRNNIKVVITGEGADEFLAGYDIFKEAKIREFWAREPESEIRPRLLSRLYSYMPSIRDASPAVLRLFFGYKLNETKNPFYSHLLRWHNTSRIRSFLSRDISSELSSYDPVNDLYDLLPPDFEKWSVLSRAQYLESTIFMSGYLLSSQGERMMMANSVEGRYPFLDHRVIEFCNRLPERWKLNGLNEKYLLKKMSEGMIPDSVRKRIKQPYRAPVPGKFLLSDESGFLSEILSQKKLDSTGLFDSSRVNTLIKKIRSKKEVSEVDQMALTTIISTQLLYKMFLVDPVMDKTNNLSDLRIVTEARAI